MPGCHGRPGEYENVAALAVAQTVDPREPAGRSPADRGHITDFNTAFLQTVIDKSGTVECVRPLRTADIPASFFGLRDLDQLFHASAGRRSGGGRGAAGRA